LSGVSSSVISTPNYISSHPSQAEPPLDQFANNTPFTSDSMIYSNNCSQSSNKNLSSLVDIVNSIGDENCNNLEIPMSGVINIPMQEPPMAHILAPVTSCKSNDIKKKKKTKIDEHDIKKKSLSGNLLSTPVHVTYCLTCLRVKTDLCTCHISKMALNRLYRHYYTDFSNNAIYFQNNGSQTFYQGSDLNSNLAFKNRHGPFQLSAYKHDNVWPPRMYTSFNGNSSNQFYSYFENENEKLIQVL
jgi:hypothetical protein